MFALVQLVNVNDLSYAIAYLNLNQIKRLRKAPVFAEMCMQFLLFCLLVFFGRLLKEKASAVIDTYYV